MPSVSKAQQRLMGAAEHGANFPMARKIRQSMTHQQMHDFASGSEKGKPEHVKAPNRHPHRNLGKHYGDVTRLGHHAKKRRDMESYRYGQ